MEFFSFGGNWIDLIILSFLVFSLFGGWRRGFLGGFFDLLSFLASFVLALKFYPLGAKLLMMNFSLSLGVAKALSFFSIGLFTELIITFFLELIYAQIPSSITQDFSNRLMGFLASLGQALIFTAFVLALIITLPVRGDIKRDVISSKIGGFLVSQTQGLEQELNQIFGGAIEETLNFFTVKTGSRETVELRFTQKELSVDEASEQEMFILVNEERVKLGLEELIWNENLTVAARAHAKDMFERGYFSHYSPEGLSPADRLKQARISYLTTGENLALTPSAEIAHQGLMESPGHRANILSADFGKVGIGVVDGGIYGKMFVQEFTD